MDPTTVLAIMAGLAVVLKLLGIADRAAHTFGMSKMFSAQLRHLATMPGNKLAPIEENLANAIDAGKDEAALAKVEEVVDAAKGATSVGQVAGVIARETGLVPPFAASSAPVVHGPQP